MRGVHGFIMIIASALLGSSPHARGPQRGRRQEGILKGIIPACAGSTDREKAKKEAAQDHPRMRGVHVRHACSSFRNLGSSPHARGPRRDSFPASCNARIIPACAGSTRCMVRLICSTRDHPRMRGVHPDPASEILLPVGSSPHARGPLPKDVVVGNPDRIIPACAGSTSDFIILPPVLKDHPRMRGVHTVGVEPLKSATGSSPHARGPLKQF